MNTTDCSFLIELSAIPEDRRANNDCSLSAAALSRHNGGMKPSPNKSVRSREDRSETAATTMSNRSGKIDSIIAFKNYSLSIVTIC